MLARVFANSFTSDAECGGGRERELWANDLHFAEIACPSVVCELCSPSADDPTLT